MRQTLLLLLLALSPLAAAEDLTQCKNAWNITQAGDHLGAVARFETCIKEGALTNASLARTYRNIGIAYRRAQRPAEAIEAFNKAIALKPSDVEDDYINRGNAYDDAGKFKEALADYDKALEIKPGHGEAFYNRGVAYEGQKMFDKAKADFIAAYEHGLRSRLLYERFVVYGLVQPEGE